MKLMLKQRITTRRTRSLLAACGALAVAATTPALGTLMTIEPLSSSAVTGGTVDVAVRISGLGDGIAPSLGAFDFKLAFDPGILSYDFLTFGDPVLADQLGPIAGSLSGFSIDSITGVLNLFAISLDTPGDVDALQANDFILASIRFSAIGGGVSTLDFMDILLGDAVGAPLSLDDARGATVTVTQAVPEGGMPVLGLFLFALTGIFGAFCKLGQAARAADAREAS